MQPPRPGVHGVLQGLLPLDEQLLVLDLGCGSTCLGDVGLDLPAALTPSEWPPVVGGDLDRDLPFADGSVDAIVSHNVLECLADPSALLAEAARVLRPGGDALWSHTDFAGLVVDTEDADLGRRVLTAYADHAQDWMRNVDGRIARRLPGLVAASPLELVEVVAHTEVATERTGPAALRIDEITLAVGEAVLDGDPGLSLGDLERWRAQVDEGDFYLAETTVIALSRRRWG